MAKIINARASISRKVEYRLTTTIEKYGGGLRVVKRTAYPEGAEFLKSLAPKTSELAKFMKPIKNLSVPPANEAVDGSIWSPYVAGSTLDEEFSIALLRRDSNKMNELLETVLDIINSLSTSRAKVSPEAKYIFGSFGTDEKTELLDCGYIDFNLDNFIRGTTGLHLLDAEFKYSFGVPKQYVVNRLIISYLARYGYLTGAMASENFPVMEIGTNIFIPKSVWDKFGDRFIDLPASIRAEKTFQKYYNYTKGIELELKPSDNWQTHTSSLFKDPVARLQESSARLRDSAVAHKQLSDALRETHQALENYRNHWLIKNANRVRRKLR